MSALFSKPKIPAPIIQKREPITLEDHQRSPMIADPLRRLDCCLVTEGGGACIVTSAERARDLKQPLVLVSGFGQVHSAEIIRPWDDGRGGGAEAAETAYRMAGVVDIHRRIYSHYYRHRILQPSEKFGRLTLVNT